MNLFLSTRTILWASLLGILPLPLAWSHAPGAEMAHAASAWLASLDDAQRAKATFEFKDDERQNWHFIPKERKGLPFKEMTPAQTHLGYALLASGLSQRGQVKALTIMSLEQILHELEQGKGPRRDSELYYLSIFGQPSNQASWGWRVEGHHLALNFAIHKGREISVTPSFFGSNPAEVRGGPRKGLRVLAAEEDLGRQLVRSLNSIQKKAAIIDSVAPKDIVTGSARSVTPLEKVGLPYAKMDPQQRELLVQLIKEYVDRYRPEVADRDLEKIHKAGLDHVQFAWAGSLEPALGHYYRIQGPTFLMEYDNTQNNANHIHSVWRDFENDFGGDPLRRHYQAVPHK